MQFLRHFFTPHYTNNYRAKILHNTSLFVFALLLLTFSSITYLTRTVQPSVLGISYSISEGELLQDTNNARVASGLSALSLNSQLSNAARGKASDMFAKDYWAHFAPDGTTPWSFIKAANYDYVFAGENLAKGFTNSQDVVNAWLNSPSHRENLLSDKYKDIGFAVVEGRLQGEDTVLVVQMFGAPASGVAVVPQAPQVEAQVAIPEVQKTVAVEDKPLVVQNAPAQRVAAVKSKNSTLQPIISAPSATKSASIVFLVFIIGILVLDLLIVERRKIPRMVGHNLDHVILLLLFLLFILLETNSKIL